MVFAKIKYKIPAALFICSVATLCLGQADEKLQYRLKLQAGESYYLENVVKQTTTRTIDGKEHIVEQTKTFNYNLEVEEVEPSGNIWIDCKYELIKVEHKEPDKTITYDSSKKNRSVPLSVVTFAALVDEHFYIRLTPKGRIDKVNGIAAMRRYMASKIPKHPTKEQIVKNLKNQINEQVITNLFEDFLAVYPDEAVAAGDSWNRTEDRPNAPGIYRNTWTLKESKDGKAIIENTTAIEPNPRAKIQSYNGIRSAYRISGRQTGQIVIDESTHLAESARLVRDIIGQTEILTGAERVQQLPAPIKVHTVLTYQLSKRQQQQQGDTAK